ncbi:hypothetical protein KFK09_026039 [Dendrobium nobile]|uniref:Uncharacterized protein n=1 Tax=Dendrobium nobile TaxID=94219 RepID=A0A8T3A6T6_DENNO|nr:hypothetical protein KFK09_026039 [Dendrobium nobile]
MEPKMGCLKLESNIEPSSQSSKVFKEYIMKSLPHQKNQNQNQNKRSKPNRGVAKCYIWQTRVPLPMITKIIPQAPKKASIITK